MNPAQQAFENAILAAPDDDAPRLIYADWLHENGDEEYEAMLRDESSKRFLVAWSRFNNLALLFGHAMPKSYPTLLKLLNALSLRDLLGFMQEQVSAS